MALNPLGVEAEVFRLVSHNGEHFPPDAPKPHPAAFQLTRGDLSEGAERGLPPILSVFDVAKTTTAQARSIRHAQAQVADREPPQMTPFGLLVAAIRSIAVPQGFDSLDVVADPLEVKWGDGSDGHAGISGLDGKKGTPDLKNKVRLIRVALVDACYRIVEA